MPTSRFLRRWLGLSLGLHLLAAVFSVGFEQADEFFQIHEFTSYKLEKATAHDMPWEFEARMRPWLQPAVLYGMTRVLGPVGVDRPSSLAFFFRLLSSLLGWASLAAIVLVARPWFSSESYYRASVALASTFWCLPYLHARTSSENWGASFFLMGLAIGVDAIRRNVSYKPLLACGLFWGIAFLCRYQMGFMIVGAGLWGLIVARSPRILWTLPSLFLVLFLGVVLDSWGYGEWTLAPWNYLRVNLLEGKAASDFGVSPFWAYLTFALRKVPPMGILALCLLVAGWWVQPKHILTWVTVPFVLIHQILAHKELRFLYPVMVTIPFFAVFLYDRAQRTKPRLARWGYLVLFFLNLLYVPLGTFAPANSWEWFYRAVDQFGENPVHLYSQTGDPYVGTFFKFPQLTLKPVEDWERVDLSPQVTSLLFVRGRLCPRLDLDCERVFVSHPEWWTVFDFPRMGLGWVERTTTWSVFHCNK